MKSLYFYRFEVLDGGSTGQICNMLSNSPHIDDDQFVINELDGSIIDGYFITSVLSKEVIFNEETMSLTTVLQKKKVAVPFTIDVKGRRLDAWCNRTNAGKLTLRLGILLKHTVIIEPLTIDLFDVLGRIHGKQWRVGKVKISDYPIEHAVVASCSFDLKTHKSPLDIVRKYSKNITQMALSIEDSIGESLGITIYKSGSVMVNKSKEEVSTQLLEQLRELCHI